MFLDLDKQYDNGARVPKFPQILQQWQSDAESYRATSKCQLDLAYGAHERQKVDLFGTAEKINKPKGLIKSTPNDQAKDKPMFIFVHGGYWRALGRETFSHMAKGLNENGYPVLVPSYQLCPQAEIRNIILDLSILCAWSWRNYGRKMVIVGHSAGGHLAAAMLATDWADYDLPDDIVSAGLGISGLYDLRPLIPTKLNDSLQLDDAGARNASPLLWPTPQGKKFQAWVGGDESQEFIRQSETIAACWLGGGAPTKSVTVPNKNHFTVIDQLLDGKSDMVKALIGLARP